MEETKGSTTSSRWNPTKEQIAVLEELYRQGMCTPSAEQIQQITGKLSEYGSIEGKNVFYWFQNHKARQRQRQKQESFAYFSRLLHRAPPPPQPIVQSPPSPAPLSALPPSACTNVVCSPCCLPVAEVGNVGYCQPHYPNILPLGAIKRKPTSQLPRITERSGGIHPEAYIHSSSIHGHHHGSTGHAINGGNVAVGANVNDSITHQNQMLELFPLHPTGFLEDRSRSSLTTASGGTESLEEGEEGEAGVELGLANFFCAPRMS